MITDWLALEGEIVTALQAALPTTRILTMATMAQTLTETGQQAPACVVLYMGDSVKENSAGGQASALEQRWVVVIVTRNARQLESGKGVRTDAGPLLATVQRTLNGYRPLSDFGPLKRAASPGPQYDKANGLGFFSVAYTASASIASSTNAGIG